MIRRVVHIHQWEIDAFFCIKKYDEDVLEKALDGAYAPIDIIVRMREIARDDEYNTGFTYTNKRLRKTVMVIGKTTSPSEFVNTFAHEIRHATDDIAQADGIGVRGEEVAYLEGEISREYADILGKLICPSCHFKTLRLR